MNTLYIHGWGSAFDPQSEKAQILSELGRVRGPNLDYAAGFDAVKSQCLTMLMEDDYDVIIGTSLGGYTASHVAPHAGLPFVAINPIVDPARSLERYLGTGLDHQGRTYRLEPDTIRTLPPMSLRGFGLILLDRGDELLDSEATAVYVGDRYPIVMYDGGCHRFAHTRESLPHIRNLVNSAEQVYGVETE